MTIEQAYVQKDCKFAMQCFFKFKITKGAKGVEWTKLKVGCWKCEMTWRLRKSFPMFKLLKPSVPTI